MNTCYNCLDRHIKNGKGSRTALIYDSPLSGKIEMYSYQNLQRLVSIYSCLEKGCRKKCILKGIVGGFVCPVLQRNLKEWHDRPRTYVREC